MQYKEFLDHIYQRYSGNVKLELTRMKGLLEDMGSPQSALCGFHVAGTNGKGSVCATLESLALAHGHSTGLNTSPHLIDYTERFRINGKELPFEQILEQFNLHEALFQKWDASFFEITTAIAFQIFANESLDTSVIEVGLGGRLDATNLFVPDVCAITTIGLDHVKTLGGTKEIIAAEKAGIIKESVPLVLGDIEASPLRVIEEQAITMHAPTYIYGRDWFVQTSADDTAGITFDYHFKDYHFTQLTSNLMGEHQATNLGTALTAFILYSQMGKTTLNEDHIRHALQNINWQGRMQVLSKKPTVIIDGAHNVHGVTALINTLEKVYPQRMLRFVISILADKDYSEMIHLFCSKAEKIFVAQNNSDRAATVSAQLAAVQKYNVQCLGFASVKEAFLAALAECKEEDVLVAGGSLYTVGEIISAYKDHA